MGNLMMISLFWLTAWLRPAAGDALPGSIYDFRVPALDGGVIDFSAFRGKKILIVNTASKCGFTPQYAALEKLYEEHKGRLVIVGFPANNFLWQEPGTAKEIASFCTQQYGVTFPMAAKISVKGRKQAPIYSWLTRKKYNGYNDSRVKWNFQKYLIDETGKLVAVFGPGVKPDSEEIREAISK